MAQIKDPNHERLRGSLMANELGFSLRISQWRYILYRDGSKELYDHRQDPMEWANLADQPKYTKIKANLRTQIPAQPAKPRKK